MIFTDGSYSSYNDEGSPNYNHLEDANKYQYCSYGEPALGFIEDLDTIDYDDLIRMDPDETTMAYREYNLDLSESHNPNYINTRGDYEGKYA